MDLSRRRVIEDTVNVDFYVHFAHVLLLQTKAFIWYCRNFKDEILVLAMLVAVQFQSQDFIPYHTLLLQRGDWGSSSPSHFLSADGVESLKNFNVHLIEC